MERPKRRCTVLPYRRKLEDGFDNAPAKKEHSSGQHSGDEPDESPLPSREDEVFTEESLSSGFSDADYEPTLSPSSSEKIGKLLFALEHGARSLKGKTLQKLDSVISGVKKRSSDAGGQQEAQDDGSKDRKWRNERQKENVKRKCEQDDDDWDGEDRQTPATRTPGKGPKKSAVSRECSDDDGEDRQTPATRTPGKGPKKSAVSRECSDDDGEDRQTPATRTPGKGPKKSAVSRECSDDDTPEIEVKKQGKRPWNDQEKTAVKRGLAKFISLRRVPAKHDCEMCISESPDLKARNWKDVKYFVYNEIAKVKRKLSL